MVADEARQAARVRERVDEIHVPGSAQALEHEPTHGAKHALATVRAQRPHILDHGPERRPPAEPHPEPQRMVVAAQPRSEEHTSELQSPCNLVCRLLLEKKKKKTSINAHLTYRLP